MANTSAGTGDRASHGGASAAEASSRTVTSLMPAWCFRE